VRLFTSSKWDEAISNGGDRMMAASRVLGGYNGGTWRSSQGQLNADAGAGTGTSCR
jgi:hypothetical protein